MKKKKPRKTKKNEEEDLKKILTKLLKEKKENSIISRTLSEQGPSGITIVQKTLEVSSPSLNQTKKTFKDMWENDK